MDFFGMSPPLLTVEQAAEQLGLHVKTVLRYIKDGRLAATRIGKSYRIPRTELDALMGLPGAAAEAGPSARTTSITELSGIAINAAERIATFLQSVAMSGDGSAPPLHLQTAFDPLSGVLKIVIIGDTPDVARLLQMLDLHMTSRR